MKREADDLTPALRNLKKQAEADAQRQFPCDPDSPNWVGSVEAPEDDTFADTLPKVIERVQESYDLKPNQVRKRLLEKGYVEKNDNWDTHWYIQWNPELAEKLRSRS